MPVERFLYLEETGNEKLAGGKKAHVLQWNMPRDWPAKGGTCAGATPTCRSFCYAERIFTQYGCSAVKSYTMLDYLVEKCEIALVQPGKRIDFMRFHVSGDFFHPSYVEAAIRFIDDMHDFPVLIYTRAWKVPRMRHGLMELASRPNVHLWLSCDPDTGIPPREMSEKIPTCYMTVADNAFDDPHGQVRLVFRAYHKMPMVTGKYRFKHPIKDHQGVPVCPPQMGNPKYKRLTCFECRYCFDEALYMKKASPFKGYGRHSAGKYPKNLPPLDWTETTEV